MRYIFHLHAGGCGACAAEVWSAVQQAPALTWAATPETADLIVLTGALLPSVAPEVLSTLQILQGRIPLVVVGQCASDSTLYGSGGLRQFSQLAVRRSIRGCPPLPAMIVEALRQVLSEQARGGG